MKNYSDLFGYDNFVNPKLRVEINGGGEYLGFAKKKLAEMKRIMKISGVDIYRKKINVGNVTIALQSISGYDLIRITGGTQDCILFVPCLQGIYHSQRLLTYVINKESELIRREAGLKEYSLQGLWNYWNKGDYEIDYDVYYRYGLCRIEPSIGYHKHMCIVPSSIGQTNVFTPYEFGGIGKASGIVNENTIILTIPYNPWEFKYQLYYVNEYVFLYLRKLAAFYTWSVSTGTTDIHTEDTPDEWIDDIGTIYSAKASWDYLDYQNANSANGVWVQYKNDNDRMTDFWTWTRDVEGTPAIPCDNRINPNYVYINNYFSRDEDNSIKVTKRGVLWGDYFANPMLTEPSFHDIATRNDLPKDSIQIHCLNYDWYLSSSPNYKETYDRVYDFDYTSAVEKDRDTLNAEILANCDSYGYELFTEQMDSIEAPHGYLVVYRNNHETEHHEYTPKLQFHDPGLVIDFTDSELNIDTHDNMLTIWTKDEYGNPYEEVGLFRYVNFTLDFVNDCRYSITYEDYNDNNYCLFYNKILSNDTEVWKYSAWSLNAMHYKDWYKTITHNVITKSYMVNGISKSLSFTKTELANFTCNESFVNTRALITDPDDEPVDVTEVSTHTGTLLSNPSCQFQSDGTLLYTYMLANYYFHYDDFWSYRWHNATGGYTWGFHYMEELPYPYPPLTIDNFYNIQRRVFLNYKGTDLEYTIVPPEDNVTIEAEQIDDPTNTTNYGGERQYRIALFNMCCTSEFSEPTTSKEITPYHAIQLTWNHSGNEQVDGYVVIRKKVYEGNTTYSAAFIKNTKTKLIEQWYYDNDPFTMTITITEEQWNDANMRCYFNAAMGTHKSN